MTDNKVYKVIFRGTILPGFEKSQVVDNVHKITRIPKETINRKFFSGKNVVIRHADSQEDAERLKNTFTQAGIETQIEQSQQSNTKESEADKSDYNSSTNTHSHFIKASSVLISAMLIILLLVMAYFFYPFEREISEQTTSENQAQLLSGQSKSKKNAFKQELSTTKSKLSTNNILTVDNLLVFIKITDTSESKQLIDFLPFISHTSQQKNMLKRLIKINLKASDNNPAYLFVSNNNSGLILPHRETIDRTSFEKIQEELTTSYKQTSEISLCKQTRYTARQINNSLLLSNFTNDDSKKLSINLFQRLNHSLFNQNNDSAKFYLYFKQLPETDSGLNSSFTLLASNNKFWLNTEKNIPKSLQKSVKALGISVNNNHHQVLSKQLNSLYHLTQILSGQLLSNTLFDNKKTSEDTFKPEPVVSHISDASGHKLKPYNKELDVDLKTQWQSGPFAITTNQLIFSDQLNIELLAKGQNIPNYLEYSQLASISTNAVYNNKNENILDFNCSGNSLDKSFFKDIDGEQEAFINDDFVSFMNITATKQVPIKPGHHLKDINKIDGSIHLELPRTIKQYNIGNIELNGLYHFKYFSIFIQSISTKKIRFQIIGDKSYFLNIRALDSHGEIIDTVHFKKRAPNKINNYRFEQSFSKKINSLVINYSEDNKKLEYHYSIKPNIEIAASVNDEQYDMIEPVTYEEKKLDLELLQLTESVVNDNPQWFGDKVKLIPTPPFYTTLFVHDKTELLENYNDALLNIKAPPSSLISQNLTAVKLNLMRGGNTLFDQYLSFTKSVLLPEYDNPTANESSEISYLNSNSAIQLKKKNLNLLTGTIQFNLPTEIKSHSIKYQAPGQVIKLDNILVKNTIIGRQKVQFKVSGNIDSLVQLKLFNKRKQLVSKPFEFKQINNREALLTLIYNDEIDLIKVYISNSKISKTYPLKFM